MFKFIFGIIIGIVCIIFFVQNGEIVNVTFLAWTLTLPRYLLMRIVLVAGIFLGWISTSLSFLKKRRKNKN
ncbi:MAG: LapA family protein [Spirochaetaceae bacterium]|jgi:uncharacterized integral membrane protein|nr:LapA family protein [Spirochaetaceae bacterium]